MIRFILDVDDTELPDAQLKYLEDNASHNVEINVKNTYLFQETLLKKHELDEIYVFEKGQLFFSSTKNASDEIYSIYEMFIKTQPILEAKQLFLKSNKWISVVNKGEKIFIIKSITKKTEFEINAIHYDFLNANNKQETIENEKTGEEIVSKLISETVKLIE